MAIAFWSSAFSKVRELVGPYCRISIALGFVAPRRSTPRPKAGQRVEEHGISAIGGSAVGFNR